MADRSESDSGGFDTILRGIAYTPEVPLPDTFSGTARYEVVRRLGQGAFGTVYEALDRQEHLRVALKVLRRADTLNRFKLEFRSIADVSHENLARLYELLTDGQSWFFTMELVEGDAFLDYVGRSQVRLRSSLVQLTRGLGALHGAGKLHRDVKPSNVLVGHDGRVVVLDFGFVTELDAQQSSRVVGTPHYMSPEQARHLPLTEASDWYAVGVMMYEALTGRPPFTGSVRDILEAKQSCVPPRPRELAPNASPDLEALCLELLSPDPARRPAASEILERLGGSAAELVTAPPRELFLWREGELSELRRMFHASRSGRAAMALVHGVSGIGKTALIGHFLREVARHHDDAVVLSGRCYERESVPYKALDSVVDSLARMLQHMPESDVQAVLPRDARTMGQLFPTLLEVPAIARFRGRLEAPGEPTEVRRRGIWALRELLARLADRRPVVIAVDDLQWGDADSASLIAEILRPPDGPSLLFVAAWRSDEGTSSPLLKRLAELRKTALSGLPAIDLPLAELSEEGSRRLAAALLAEVKGASGVDPAAVARAAGGNPFLVQELVRHRGTTAASLDEAILSRVAALAPAARMLLEVVSVADRPIEVRTAARVADAELHTALPALRTERLVRLRETDHERQIEPYHARIREAVLSALPPGKLRAIHAALGETFAAAEPQRAAFHLLEAGELARGAELTISAAERAREALAFDRAAELYALALRVRADAGVKDGRTHALRVSLADALAAAGRCPEAAEAYFAAVASADMAEALVLRRRAAEELLISGNTQRGRDTLAEVLASMGLPFPESWTAAFASLVRSRTQLALRGLKVKARPEVPAGERLKMDALRAAATGLVVFEPLIAAALHSQCLLRALDAGEPTRLVLALAAEASGSAYRYGVSRSARTRSLIEAAQSHASPTHGESWAFLRNCEASIALFEGRWAEAYERFVAAEAELGESGQGVGIERTRATLLRFTALFWMGRYGDAGRELPRVIQGFEERGNAFGALWMSLYEAAVLASRDRVGDARACADAAVARWPTVASHLQSWFRAVAEINFCLYEGDGAAAWQEIKRLWPRLTQDRTLWGQLSRVEAHWMRARAALACAAGRPASSRAELLHDAARSATRLRREKAPWADALARTVEGSLAFVEGRRDEALVILGEAEPLVTAHGLEVLAAAVKRSRGLLLGSEQGRLQVTSAEAWMRSQHIASAERCTAAYLPGRWA